MDEGFIATAYPEVQENLKLTVDEQMIPEEPCSYTGTLSSLQHLTKDFSYGDQFIDDKPNNKKTTLPLPPQPQQGPSDPIIIKRMGELEELIVNLVEENQALEARLGKQGSRINKLETIDLPKMIREQTVEFIDSQEIDRKINESVKEVVISSNYDKGHADHRVAYEALQVSIRRDECEDFDVDKAQEETKKKSKQDSPKTLPGSPPSPPPPPLPPSTSTAALSSSKTAASAEYSAWTTTDTRIKPSITTIPDDLYMSCGKPLTEDRPASTDCFGPSRHLIAYNVSKPLPLGGEPGHITIQSDFFFNKDLEYLRYGRKIGRPALSISKMKAAFYPDVGLGLNKLGQLWGVPDQFWIEEECKYDIAAMYGISHWWFQRQRFYIDRFSLIHRRLTERLMNQLSVVRIEVFSMYGYNYRKKIILRQVDLKEYVIAERDFKYMYPSNFEDLYLLNLQGHLNHLSPDDKKTQLNLTKPRWDATEFEFKHDYTVIDSPRAVTFRDKCGVQMIMRFNEIHKFSDGTLQQINEALDYRIKEFRVNRINPGMNTRFWTKKDVVRSKEFMFAIQKWLKTRRIFRNLESFVGGRIREGDYRSYKDGKVRYSLPRSRQNRRDLPRDNPLVSVEVLRHMLKSFDKEDLETLWKLVKAKHGSTRPEEGYERLLWGDLKTMFDPHVDDLEKIEEKYSKYLLPACTQLMLQFDEKRGTIFNSNKEIVMIAPRVRDVYVLDMTSSELESFYIHNHKDYLGKFDEKADDGYFLGYSLVSKAFRIFNTRRQKTKETYHITFDESTDTIKFNKPSVDNISIVESERYPPDEYLHPYEPS
ncbi:retrovirus-related pol polyprotein from transposon TNT 1-94 [Tanacetum coccineum]|uniref:Retrovirus-related pol polyprotein from transposon TNT 1-94 n=1 Tax=Tanacetum coccineum TaxID=301880 RepID=A0ABQ5G291_9ASTR